MRRLGLLIVILVGCGDDGGGGGQHHDAAIQMDAAVDAAPDAPPCVPLMQPTCGSTTAPTTPATSAATCNPLTQAGCAVGEKCTWIIDQVTPQMVGHIGCAPDGTVATGCACSQGAPGTTGYDDCAKGNYCQRGVCKQLCDNQGGQPSCDADHACSTYSGLFSTGGTTPAAAGVCDVACNPLTENNLLGGPGANCRCGSGTACYGYPSFGTPPVTAWTCNNVLSGSETLVHRTPVTGTVFVNSCAPGYLPLLRESTMVSTAVCIAMCGPKNCYAGNCGPNDENRLGAAPHRCNTTDARGMFNTAPDGEACRYIWSFEIDDAGNFLRSPTSDTLGFCFDHSKYQYDSNNDGMPDKNLPTCQELPDGFGSGTDPSMPTTYFGAADLGCVDTTHAGLTFTGKTGVIGRKPRGLDEFRPLLQR